MTASFVVVALLVLLAGLAAAIYRQRRENQTLRAQLEAIATDLQHLQQSCSRLVCCSTSSPTA